MESEKYKYVVGIDEVGRGPVAGVVTVGGVLMPRDFDTEIFVGVKDSKKLSEKKREEWALFIKEQALISSDTHSVSSSDIDTNGIAQALRDAVAGVLEKLNVDEEETFVYLDGGLRAPEKFIYQESIVRGDENEVAITLASIVAKVHRDREMVSLANKYPEYGFEKHKGYGTKFHFEQIKKHGMCDIHRRSFLKSIFES